jgi:hypothetical protein
MAFGLLLEHSVESIFKFMNPNVFQPLTVRDADEIRKILVKRVDQQKQAVGIVAGIIEPNLFEIIFGSLEIARTPTRTIDTVITSARPGWPHRRHRRWLERSVAILYTVLGPAAKKRRNRKEIVRSYECKEFRSDECDPGPHA